VSFSHHFRDLPVVAGWTVGRVPRDDPRLTAQTTAVSVIRARRPATYTPVQKRAEKRNIQRWSEQIFRFFGLGQGTTELMKFYDITLDGTHDSSTGTYLLLLEPKKRRVRKRIPEVRFWLDKDTYLPARVEYRSKSGNTRVVEFHQIRLNPDLAANLYHVEIPSDVQVSSGFSGLPSFNPDSTQ
jgi:hypothetical protein